MECFTTAETSYDEHLFLVAIQEYLMQQLGLPHHVLEKCTADIGRPNAKGVDVEVWLPSQGMYRETHTADYIGDYQTRRELALAAAEKLYGNKEKELGTELIRGIEREVVLE
jgi:seryl-tRNA synthetase